MNKEVRYFDICLKCLRVYPDLRHPDDRHKERGFVGHAFNGVNCPNPLIHVREVIKDKEPTKTKEDFIRETKKLIRECELDMMGAHRPEPTIPTSLDDKEGWKKYTEAHGRSWDLCLEHMTVGSHVGLNCYGPTVYERPKPQATSELDESVKIRFIEETRKNIDQIMKELGQKIMKDDAEAYEKYLKDRELKSK